MLTLTLDRAALARAVRAVLPHASRDPGDTPYCAVRFEAGPGGMTVVASGEHTMGAAFAGPSAGDPGAAAAMVTAADARDILRRLRSGAGPAVLGLYEDGWLSLDWQARYQPPCRDYLPWRSVLLQVLRGRAALPGRDRTISPAYLARFAAASSPGGRLALMPVTYRREPPSGPGREVRAHAVLGPGFAGAAADGGLPGAGFDPGRELAAWRDRLAAAAPDPASAEGVMP